MVPGAVVARAHMRVWALEWRAWRHLLPLAVKAVEEKGGVL
jgi:hypothetical protein